MASLMDKLMGKAPFREPEDESKKEDVKPVGNKKPSAYNKQDFIDIGKWAFPILCCVIVVIVANMVGDKINQPARNKIAQQATTYTDTLNNIDIKTNQYNDMLAQEDALADFHYYNGDTSEDNKIASDYFAKYCTWSDGETYENLRASALNEGYTDDSSFMVCLLPAQFVYQDETYKKYYAIDTYSENMRFESLDDYALSFNASLNQMEYAGILTLASNSFDESGMAVTEYTRCFVTYSISDGTIKDVNVALLVD